MKDRATPGKVGILVGGGPAPGINGVIGSATIEASRRGIEVVGIYDGFKWLARGDADHVRRLTPADVEEARFRGGSILRTSRENPTKDQTKMANVVKTLNALSIDRLVTIGGDDTALSAVRTGEASMGGIRVAHVPKTIDNDLPLPDRIPTFGFNTACDIGARLVRNLAEDARTTSRWYLAVAMGRTAGHLALGMGVGGGAARIVIPEEFGGEKVTLDRICEAIEEAMINARASGKGHGVAVVAEGVGELIKDELAERFRGNPLVKTEYDEHGHVRLAEVPFGLIIKRELQTRAEKRGGKLAMVDVTIGYELRCADPIPFDVNYTHQLGWGAIEYLTGVRRPDWPEHGALICVQASNLRPIAFPDIIDVRSGRTKVRVVDTGSDAYRSAVAVVTG